MYSSCNSFIKSMFYIENIGMKWKNIRVCALSPRVHGSMSVSIKAKDLKYFAVFLYRHTTINTVNYSKKKTGFFKEQYAGFSAQIHSVTLTKTFSIFKVMLSTLSARILIFGIHHSETFNV